MILNHVAQRKSKSSMLFIEAGFTSGIFQFHKALFIHLSHIRSHSFLLMLTDQ